MQLNGKHVVVTGAARGIGAALARRFHAAGAKVVLADRDGVAEAADGLPGTVEVIADVGTEAGNVTLIEAAEAAFGPIDLFFANAGVGFGGDPMSSDEVWDASFAVNVHAHRWAAKHLLPGWLARGEGYFCSTASAAGVLAQIGSAPYSVTKHAAVAFAEWMSITYGDQGVRVSCLCPQGVNTHMLRAGDGLGAGAGGNVVRMAGIVLEPDDVAEAAHAAIEAEEFFVFPHPEVADYLRLKGDQPERWLAGMRKLQRRVAEASDGA
ncbi:MAG: SDR family oxidoreductase [Ilumatobacter sp.]|nr:MAG: SDR family oxidoreductase [Ilumatobacter sp.]